jgi:hypothetical protein
MKEEKIMMKHSSHKIIYKSGNKNKGTANHKQKKLLTEFVNLTYVSGPLSRWVRLSYFSSKLQKYIIKVPNGLQAYGSL